MTSPDLPWHEIEDAKYSSLYADNYPAGNPMGLVNKFCYQKILDACDLGCGRATLSGYFEKYTGVDVSKYIIDLNKKTRAGNYFHASLHDLSQLYNKEFDLVICADVLEHIPPQEVKGVLNEISKLKANRFSFAISTRPSDILDKDGNNLHLTVRSNNEWTEGISDYFKVIQRIDTQALLSVELVKK